MPHEIDQSTGEAAMAYAGAKPWHGLGQEVSPDDPLETWVEKAGFNWELISSPAYYQSPLGEMIPFSDRNILFRSDTHAALGLVSGRYKVVQPADVAEFFRDLTEYAGFKMETMGVLHHGKKYWGLAKVGEGFELPGDGEVNPYILLATSCDGTMATVAHLTSVRVVCQNTLTLSVGAKGKKAAIQIPHVNEFQPKLVKEQLGLIPEWWSEYHETAKQLADRSVTREEATRFFLGVTAPALTQGISDDDLDGFLDNEWEPAEDSPAAQAAQHRNRVTKYLEIYETAPGALTESASGTAWGMVNSVTRFWDHERVARGENGRDNRLSKAWFGKGAVEKSRAYNLAKELL